MKYIYDIPFNSEKQVEDQCLVMLNVHRLLSFIFKTGSRYQSIADNNHCSTEKQRMGRVRDGWMLRGRTATSEGGEDPLLTRTLIINMCKRRNEGTQEDA